MIFYKDILRVSHRVPLQPFTHSQIKKAGPMAVFVHVPLFWHGVESQGAFKFKLCISLLFFAGNLKFLETCFAIFSTEPICC